MLRARPARAWLRWLVLACIVPSWLLAVAVSYRSYERERSALLTSAQSAADNLMRATERDLAGALALLRTLAGSPDIVSGDFNRLQNQLVEAQRAASAYSLFLVDPQLQVLARSQGIPKVGPAVQLKQDRFPQLWRGAETGLSNLFVGSQSPQLLVAVALALPRQGQTPLRAEMVFSTDRFSRLIEQQQLPAGWNGAIVDADRVFIALGRDNSTWAGRPAPPGLEQDSRGKLSGCHAARTLDGVRTTACFSRLPQHDWLALVAVPSTQFEAALRTALLEYSLGAAILLFAAMLLTNRMGRAITEPIRALVAPALSIGQGQSARFEPSRLKEADEVAAALQQAQALLDQRQQARQQAEDQLRDSESRWRMALEAARVGDWEVDLLTGRMQHSLRHDQCFGYEHAVADWTESSVLAHVHPEDRDAVAQSLQQAAAGGSYQLECRIVWPDRSVHWIALRGTVLTENGQPRRALGVVIDITERKRHDELQLRGLRLEAENQQILEASRLKSDFLANMSHELRTPLNAVIGFADILRSEGAPKDAQKQQQFLGHIASSGRHLLGLINDVLDLSKVEAGRMEFFPVRVRLPELVHEVVAVMQPEAKRKQIELQTQLDPSLKEVELDPARLKQVLYNFLSNAVKFTDCGGSVSLRARLDAGALLLEVEDSGIGIHATDQVLLFTPFQQVHNGASRQHQGTGLGLSLTRRLVELQGGSVGLRSSPGVGSVFFARLPLRQPVAAASTVHAEAPIVPDSCIAVDQGSV